MKSVKISTEFDVFDVWTKTHSAQRKKRGGGSVQRNTQCTATAQRKSKRTRWRGCPAQREGGGISWSAVLYRESAPCNLKASERALKNHCHSTMADNSNSTEHLPPVSTCLSLVNFSLFACRVHIPVPICQHLFESLVFVIPFPC